MLGLHGVRKMRFVACVVGFLMISHLGMASLDEETDLEDDLLGDASSVVSGSLEDEFDIKYDTPVPIGPVYFAETFDDPEAAKKTWIMSKAQKEDQENVFKYEGKWEFEHPQRRLFPNDQALVMKSKAKHHAISALLEKPFEFRDKPLIMQYEVTFQNGMDCGGAYVKLLSSVKGMKLEQVHDKTPFTIMFGPDKCGSDVKIHFIFRHKNPINGTFSEKHSKRPSNRVEETYTDKKPHLYKLKLTPENKFEVFVDERLINQGNLLEDFTPPVNPPMEIEDPNDFKPTDWDEREKIPDPTAEKPSDWDDEAALKIPDPNAVKPSGWLEDEEDMVPDPKAVKPEDWDESMDGSWEPPLINNPKCQDAAGCGPWVAPLVDNPNFKGKWRAPLIANPNYKGKWSKRMISNPDYFEDKEPFKMSPIGAVGLELWTMSDNVLFDNFIISDDDAVVDDWTSKTWELKRRIFDRDSEGVIRRLINYSNAHPWLWAIYVFVIGLPLVLIFTYCCGSSQDKKLTDAQHKKTDEISADDLLDDADQQPGKGKDVNAKSSTNSTISKEDLEEPENEDVEESEEDNAEVEEEEEEEEESEPEPEPEPVVEQKSGKGARQRKTRRD